MDKETKQIWDYFTYYYVNDKFNGNRAIDFSGCECIKASYADENSNFNWDIDHIYPNNPKYLNSLYGSNSYSNLQVLSRITNEEKANNLSGIIEINHYADGKLIKTVSTEYEVKENPLFLM